MNLRGKIALITGSTSGIGLGIAQALASRGADIALNGFGEAVRISALEEEISAMGVRAVHFPADLRNAAEIESMIASVRERLGGPDILVNNAGIQHVAPIEDFAPAQWDAVIALNLSAAFHAIRLSLPGMKSAGWGRIINLASVHGLVASTNKAAYVAAKHGLVGLTKVVALETARTNVTCNAICPGWVLTPLVQKQIEERSRRDGSSVDEARVALLGEKQPSLEFVTPEQLGELAVFLCTDAAAQVRGAAWNIDGGWAAQ